MCAQSSVSSTHLRDEYRGRIAPTPTGFLHLGHARTFWEAQRRALKNQGRVIMRIEDLDPARSKSVFVEAGIEDLRWLGMQWDEGPDKGGDYGPYLQSLRMQHYRRVLEQLIEIRAVYRCYCSRKDILAAAQAPHSSDEGPIYPGNCRKNLGHGDCDTNGRAPCWRFKVANGRHVAFEDGKYGSVGFTGGVDFGDFVVWRQDDVPSYQLAVSVDDHEMGITEVVRGEDLLVSTSRQILIYEALNWTIPDFFHCPLLTDGNGVRLSKRSNSMGIRDFRSQGWSPERIREEMF
jgi:glutamyl/glutaminyl-tRNA synthetase